MQKRRPEPPFIKTFSEPIFFPASDPTNNEVFQAAQAVPRFTVFDIFLLGTDPAHEEHYVVPAGHAVPREATVRGNIGLI